MRAVQVARMPRDIGISTGVKETCTGAVGEGLQALHDLGGVPVHAADVVRARRPDDLGTEQVGLRGSPAPEVPLTATTVTTGSIRFSAIAGRRASSAARRIAARHRDPARSAQAVPVAGQLGQPVGPVAGVRRAVEPLPRVGVRQPEVGAAVDDQRVRAEPLGQLCRVAVRQGQKHDVMARQHPRVGGSRTREASGSRCGWCSASVVPALAAAVSAPMVRRPSA